MSFTSKTKDEISKLEFTDMENISELSAIIQNNIIEQNKIAIITENSSVARKIYTLIKKIFDIKGYKSIIITFSSNKKIISICKFV